MGKSNALVIISVVHLKEAAASAAASDFSDGMCFLCIPAGSKADYRSNQRTGNAPVPDIIVTCQSMLIQPSAGQFCKKYIRQIADQ